MFLDSEFDESLSLWSQSCVDWPGFSLVFYTKVELIKHFLQKYCVSVFLHDVLEILFFKPGQGHVACIPSVWEVWAGPSEYTLISAYIPSSTTTWTTYSLQTLTF